MNSNLYNNNFEAGKIIVALNKNFSYWDLLNYHISNVFKGVDIEKVELIFHSDKINNESNMGDIVAIY